MKDRTNRRNLNLLRKHIKLYCILFFITTPIYEYCGMKLIDTLASNYKISLGTLFIFNFYIIVFVFTYFLFLMVKEISRKFISPNDIQEIIEINFSKKSVSISFILFLILLYISQILTLPLTLCFSVGLEQGAVSFIFTYLLIALIHLINITVILLTIGFVHKALDNYLI